MTRLPITIIAAISIFLQPILAASDISKPFIIKVASKGEEIDGRFIATEIRKPTYGTIIVDHITAATAFTLNRTDGTIFNGGTPHGKSGKLAGVGDIGEQSNIAFKSRVYFSTPKYFQKLRDEFDPLVCSFGAPVKGTEYEELSCTSGDRKAVFGCRGRGEAAGWYIYDATKDVGTHRHGKCADMALLAGPAPVNTHGI